MTFLLLLACAPIHVVQTCSETERTVGDDEPLDLGFSVTDLLASASADALHLVDLAGESRTAQIAFSRAEGDAALVDRTVNEEDVGGVGPNREIRQTFAGECVDELTVPVVVRLTASDTEVTAEGTLTTTDGTLQGTGVALDATFDPADSLLPPGISADPTAGAIRGHLLSDIADPTLAVWVTATDGAREAVLSTPGVF